MIFFHVQTDGSIIMRRTAGGGVTVSGLVAGARAGCPQSVDHEVALVTGDVLGWMSAVITQHTPFISVS